MVNRGRWILASLVAAALLVTGCDKGNGGAGGGGTAGAVGGESEEVPFLRKFPASTSGGPAEAMRTVVRDPVIWADLWAKANAHIAPVPMAPTVDFAKEMVAFAGLGDRKTAGYSVEIVGKREEGGKLVLLVAERDPPKDAPVAAVGTAPWHAVVLAKSDLPVEWRKYEPPHAK